MRRSLPGDHDDGCAGRSEAGEKGDECGAAGGDLGEAIGAEFVGERFQCGALDGDADVDEVTSRGGVDDPARDGTGGGLRSERDGEERQDDEEKERRKEGEAERGAQVVEA